MTKTIRPGDRCLVCKDIVLFDEELERDVRKLKGLIEAAHDFHAEIFERHGDSAELAYLNQHLGRAFVDPEELLKVLPEE